VQPVVQTTAKVVALLREGVLKSVVRKKTALWLSYSGAHRSGITTASCAYSTGAATAWRNQRAVTLQLRDAVDSEASRAGGKLLLWLVLLLLTLPPLLLFLFLLQFKKEL
jgi:hypothetical protein